MQLCTTRKKQKKKKKKKKKKKRRKERRFARGSVHLLQAHLWLVWSGEHRVNPISEYKGVNADQHTNHNPNVRVSHSLPNASRNALRRFKSRHELPMLARDCVRESEKDRERQTEEGRE